MLSDNSYSNIKESEFEQSKFISEYEYHCRDVTQKYLSIMDKKRSSVISTDIQETMDNLYSIVPNIYNIPDIDVRNKISEQLNFISMKELYIIFSTFTPKTVIDNMFSPLVALSYNTKLGLNFKGLEFNTIEDPVFKQELVNLTNITIESKCRLIDYYMTSERNVDFIGRTNVFVECIQNNFLLNTFITDTIKNEKMNVTVETIELINSIENRIYNSYIKSLTDNGVGGLLIELTLVLVSTLENLVVNKEDEALEDKENETLEEDKEVFDKEFLKAYNEMTPERTVIRKLKDFIINKLK